MSKLLNRRDVEFMLYELLDVESLTQRQRFAEHTRETFDAALDTAAKIAEEKFAPHNRKADLNEPRFENGRVSIIPEVAEALQAFRKAGFMAAAQDFEKAYGSVGKANTQTLLAKKELQQLNKALLTSEQKLGNSDGLPRRDWFKHQIYAPGFYTGYGVKTLPGVREAIEQRRWDDARAYVVRTAKVIEDYADRLDQAAAMGRPPA